MTEQLSAFDLLKEDYSGTGFRQIQETLLNMKTSIRHYMDSGLVPDDFAVAQRLLQAVESGEEALERLHSKMAE